MKAKTTPRKKRKTQSKKESSSHQASADCRDIECTFPDCACCTLGPPKFVVKFAGFRNPHPFADISSL